MPSALSSSHQPHVHALYADKRNLSLFSDQSRLSYSGLPPQMLAYLAGVPTPFLSLSECYLSGSSLSLFFKPFSLTAQSLYLFTITSLF